MPRIEHFSTVDDHGGFAGKIVGFGGTTPDSEMAWLKDLGFSTVVNLRKATEEGVDVECSRVAAQAAGLNYVHIPFGGQELDRQLVDNFLRITGDPANQPVYIHCRSATRVAALWLIGRVLKDGCSLESVLGEAETIAAKPGDAVAYATAYLKLHGGLE